jgi:hypothetical protein
MTPEVINTNERNFRFFLATSLILAAAGLVFSGTPEIAHLFHTQLPQWVRDGYILPEIAEYTIEGLTEMAGVTQYFNERRANITATGNEHATPGQLVRFAALQTASVANFVIGAFIAAHVK